MATLLGHPSAIITHEGPNAIHITALGLDFAKIASHLVLEFGNAMPEPQLTLTVPMAVVAAELERAVIGVDTATHEALLKLGWIPPNVTVPFVIEPTVENVGRLANRICPGPADACSMCITRAAEYITAVNDSHLTATLRAPTVECMTDPNTPEAPEPTVPVDEPAASGDAPANENPDSDTDSGE